MEIFGWLCLLGFSLYATAAAYFSVMHGGEEFSGLFGRYSNKTQRVTGSIIILAVIFLWYLVYTLSPFTIVVDG